MDPLAAARERLAAAARLVVFTGAGVSAESGIPTFRGAGGLWKDYRPEDLATPEAFARDPVTVWTWYGWRRAGVARCAPNPAHHAIARLMAARPGVTLVTQNVDDLQERAAGEAGAPDGPPRLWKLHGAIMTDRCSGCGAETPGVRDVDTSHVTRLPRCADCGALLRPAVTWFGEILPQDALEAAFAAAAACDACLVVGTSGSVYPAAGVVHEAHGAGADVMVVDPGETAFDGLAAAVLRGEAGRLLPGLLER